MPTFFGKKLACYCNKCGVFDDKNTLLTHRCVANSVANKHGKEAPDQGKQQSRKIESRTQVAQAIQTSSDAAVPGKVGRYVKWRAANPDTYRERQKLLMRKRRSKAKLALSPS